MSTLRDPFFFQEKLLDALEELIDDAQYQEYFAGFYAAYECRRLLPWLVEAQEGPRGALLLLPAYIVVEPSGTIKDQNIMKLTPPPAFLAEVFTIFETLLQKKPLLTRYIANSLRNLTPPLDPDNVAVADLKKILLKCIEIYAVRTSQGIGLLPKRG